VIRDTGGERVWQDKVATEESEGNDTTSGKSVQGEGKPECNRAGDGQLRAGSP